jgi:hypothetical protein
MDVWSYKEIEATHQADIQREDGFIYVDGMAYRYCPTYGGYIKTEQRSKPDFDQLLATLPRGSYVAHVNNVVHIHQAIPGSGLVSLGEWTRMSRDLSQVETYVRVW